MLFTSDESRDPRPAARRPSTRGLCMSDFRLRQRAARTRWADTPWTMVSLVFVLVFANAGRSATITPISGSRALSVNVVNETGGGTGASGPLSGRWDNQVTITRPLSREGVVRGSMTCYAEQHSNITPQSIVDNGVVRMTMVEGEGVTVTGIAQSRINLRFTIDHATPFSLQLIQPRFGLTFSETSQVFIFSRQWW